MPLRLASQAMGTRFELVLHAALDPRLLHAAGEEALFEIADAERRLSLFRRDSLLSHLARTALARPGAWQRVDADTFELLALCAEVHAASAGAFDPTVAPLLRALGLHGHDSQAPALDHDEARARVGFDAVELDETRRYVRLRPGTSLDMGAIGKGHALDLAARVLREHGVTCALLHGGTSTVLALGAPPDAPAWRVRVGRDPDAPVAELCDASLSVSAPSGRAAEDGTHHLLDPRTASPARGVRCAAVVTSGAARADAWSTALAVLGPDAAVPADVELLFGSEDAAPWQHRNVPSRPSFALSTP